MATRPANRILIVEDDPAVRRLMTTHFRRNGYRVDYAMAAEEVASDEPYDVVLTDIHLPGESGVELANRIREQQPDQPVVFVTGDADASIANRAIQSGAAGYLLKPFELFELDAVINGALRVRVPRQDSGVPVIAHRHVTRPARVTLSPRRRTTERFTHKLRVAAAVLMMLALAFLAGAAITPADPLDQTQESSFGESKPIVVPVVMDRTVYLDR
ncbi:MAG: response regulator [Gemmatimonadota bacterium]